jgi:NAD(P) transhydrogenase subunit alpha
VIASGVGLVTVFVLAAFVGFEVISKVSSILHTPLMSGANAIHGVILIGAMLILGYANSTLEVAVGGFVVTDRMLHMFRGRGSPPR